jgi:hypothetical protein
MKAFLDTTILTDAVLKEESVRKRTRAAIARCQQAQYPGYALKEFNYGPFDAYRRYYNYLVEEDSTSVAMRRVHAGILTPRRQRFATMMEASIRADEDASKGYSPSEVSTNRRERARAHRYHLRRTLRNAHRQIEKLPAKQVFPLDCYSSPKLEQLPNETLAFSESGCGRSGASMAGFAACSTAHHCSAMTGDIRKLVAALKKQPEQREISKRIEALKKLVSEGKLTHSDCQYLGDAVFTLLAPNGYVIMTTNVKHHRPMARAVGKDAVYPDEV